MATARLVPSTWSYTSASGVTVSNTDNAYHNTDNTSYTTIRNSNKNTTNYNFYLKGFDFSGIPADAIVESFEVKIKLLGQNIGNVSHPLQICNGTTELSGYIATSIPSSATIISIPNITESWNTIRGFGSEFGIRIRLANRNKNNKFSAQIYGAEILVNYTIPGANPLFIKLNNTWQNCSTLYEKINGSWIEKDPTTLDTTKRYYLKS